MGYSATHVYQEKVNKKAIRRLKVKANILNDKFKTVYLRLRSY